MKPIKLHLDLDTKDKSDLYVRQNILSRILEGQWTSKYKGQGMEFSEYRKYVYGDDATRIDWKASLKSGSTLIKEFEEDKSADALFIFDVGDSMLFSTRKDGKMKVEYAAELIYFTSTSILKSGHAVGLYMVGEKIHVKLDPQQGISINRRFKNQFLNINNYGGKFDFTEIMKRLLGLRNQKLVVIIVSDFLNLPEKWQHYIKILGQRYEVIGIMIRDHRDRYLPYEGQIVLQDPSSNESIYIDAAEYTKQYHEHVLKQEAEIESGFKSARSDLLKLETTQNPYEGIVKFFKRILVVNK